MSQQRPTPWPHAPLHRLAESGTFLVTAGTYAKEHHFRGADRLEVLQRGLLTLCQELGWQVEAWAIFSNHYHFVAHSPVTGAESLGLMLGKLHEKTAKWVNKLDAKPGRSVWHNFWETKLTYEKSYLARLNYTHQNAVSMDSFGWRTLVGDHGQSVHELLFGVRHSPSAHPRAQTVGGRQFPGIVLAVELPQMFLQRTGERFDLSSRRAWLIQLLLQFIPNRHHLVHLSLNPGLLPSQ